MHLQQALLHDNFFAATVIRVQNTAGSHAWESSSKLSACGSAPCVCTNTCIMHGITHYVPSQIAMVITILQMIAVNITGFFVFQRGDDGS